jgi:site-specific recombinase XerD
VQKKPQEVTTLDIIAFRKHLEERGLKPVTVAKKLAVLRSFYRFLHEAFGFHNPALAVRIPRVTDDSTRAVLTLQESMRLLTIIDTSTTLGKRDLAIMALLLVNGLRTIEVSRCSIEDIHEIDGVPILRVKGKGGRIADAKLRDDVYAAIQTYIATRAIQSPQEPLFLAVGNLAKGRISPKTIQERVRHWFRAAGIQKPRLSAHSLRHTAALLTLSVGKADLVSVQRMLRHSDPKVTLTYLRALDFLKDNAVDRNPISLPLTV